MKRTLLLLMVALLVAACGPLGQPSADEIVKRAEAAMGELESAHAVVRVEATVEDETRFVVGEGWMQGDQKRAEIRDASEAELVGTLAVSDGRTGWLYHPDVDKVLTGEIDALEAYHEQNGIGGEMPTSFDLSEMDLSALTEAVDALLRISDAKLVGEETIAGLEAWHLRLTPNEEAPREWVAAGGTLDLWIAKENDLPLQVAFVGNGLGEGRVTVESLELAPTMEAALFTFTPPADAEVVDVVSLLPERMTLAEAKEAAPFALLTTPADNAEAMLVAVYRTGEHYIQEFEGTLGTWTLSQGPADADKGEHHGDEMEGLSRETIKLRGTEATLLSDPARGWTRLAWEEGGQTVVIAGRLAPDAAQTLGGLLE